MAITPYPYSKTLEEINLTQLEDEIKANVAITIALSNLEFQGSDLTVNMRDSLSAEQKTELDTTVNGHVPNPLYGTEETFNISSANLEPFALPTFRTKRNATENLIKVNPGETNTLDFQLTEELYVSGGVLIVKNARIGDYVTAEVYDGDGIIPEPYRPVLAENHPTIATYIIKEYVEVKKDFTVSDPSENYVSIHVVDTYPLNAKITPGLYLRMTYHATEEANERTFAINYRLTKKLEENT